jgi:tetratricopeptide (TPR) repeat protein
MGSSEFADLVGAVAEGMGQRPDAVRGTPEGLILHTTDGFLFAFLEDPSNVSLAAVQRLLAETESRKGRLVVLTPGRLPLALSAELERGRASLVEHERFRELLRGLDLGARLGEEPRGPHDVPGNRLLPSARRLDAVVARARSWYDWGVPALALRFYRQALSLKPEFVPARIGVARCLASLGLSEEAMAAFRGILAEHPGEIEARLGEASVHAAAGRTTDEVRIYREVLEERPDRLDVRAQIIAAEVDAGRWPDARREIEKMLKSTPEDPRIRFLHAVAMRHTGAAANAAKEVDRARALGLSYEQETALCAHLGLPAPAPRPAATPAPVRNRPTAAAIPASTRLRTPRTSKARTKKPPPRGRRGRKR